MERLLKVYIDKNNTESTVDGLEALHWGHYLFGWGYGICMPALHRVTCVCVCCTGLHKFGHWHLCMHPAWPLGYEGVHILTIPSAPVRDP